MIASCHRRRNSLDAAIRIYEQLLREHDDSNPDLTAKCLQYLAAITQQIDHPQAAHYQHELQLHQQRQQQMGSPDDGEQIESNENVINRHRNRKMETIQNRDAQRRSDDEDDDDDQWADVQLDDELLPS